MKKRVLLFIAFILMSRALYAQYDATGNVTAIGLGATSTDPGYKFSYQGFSVAHYGLGWYADPDASAYGPVAYLSGFGGIKLFTGGSFRAFLTADGNLGVGTTSPAASLQISGISNSLSGSRNGLVLDNLNSSGNRSSAIHFTYNNAASQAWQLGSDFEANGTQSFYLYDAQAGVNRLYVSSNGNVGIGTTGPQVHLNIQGAESTNPSMVIQNTSYNSTMSSGTVSMQFGFADHIGPKIEAYKIANNVTGLKLYTEYGYNTPQTGLVISPTGNGPMVGIGTTVPYSTLQVTAGGNSSGQGGEISIGANATAAPMFSIKGSLSTNGISGDAGDVYFKVRPDGASALNTAMTIAQNGNIGIGTTDPRGYKLAVAGDAIAESMTVKDYVDWPDYIFKKDRRLMPLPEVKAYIEKNQHLPEVPSANEIEKDGQNLGEMNKILLKKVEELTLYLIEQQKEIDELKKKVNKQ